MKVKITELEKEADKQLLKLMDDIQCDIQEGVKALFEYLADYSAQGIDDENISHEFCEDWQNIVSSAFYSPWKNRLQPFNRQFERAIDHVALKRAKEALKND